MSNKTYYKTIWLSDLHIFSYGCKTDKLINFLNKVKCDRLYLVGDIIDGWAISRNGGIYSNKHIDVIRKILSKTKNGTKIIYIIGNHDEFLRELLHLIEDKKFGTIEIKEEDTHITLDGKKLLVIHGDQFDYVTRLHKWIAILGDIGYTILLRMNHIINKITNILGIRYWSFSSFIKKRVKSAVSYISNFEFFISEECKKRGFDGVVCGHIHSAEIKNINDILYINCGDFVESCTAIAEDINGNIILLQDDN